MSPTLYLILNGVVVILLAGFFLLAKKQNPQPTKLNLRKGRFKPVTDVEINDEEELNVYFNFNGHMWDAYEIIGVPAGAPMSDVEMAFLKSRMRIDDESKEILEMAYEAIHQKQKK
ncbi:MAG: hypothetical protein AAF203_00155 [Pseudomonadota bacterium]